MSWLNDQEGLHKMITNARREARDRPPPTEKPLTLKDIGPYDPPAEMLGIKFPERKEKK